MNNPGLQHRHLDEEQIDEIAREVLASSGESVDSVDCEECKAWIDLHSRYLSLARLFARDTRAPLGTPAIDAVRAIRRRSYYRRALRELAALTTSPLNAGG